MMFRLSSGSFTDRSAVLSCSSVSCTSVIPLLLPPRTYPGTVPRGKKFLARAVTLAGRGVRQPAPHRLQDRERLLRPRRERPVREQDDEEIAVGIDPEGRARPSRMSEAPRTEETSGTRHLLVRGHRLPAEGPVVGADVGLGRPGGEQAHRRLRHEWLAVGARAATEQELREAGEVLSGGKETGVSGNSARLGGGRIVHHGRDGVTVPESGRRRAPREL